MLAPAGNGGVADCVARRGGRAVRGLLLTLALVALTDRDAVTRAAIRDGRPAARAGRDRTVVATIVPGATGRPIPRSFLGLSTEYWSLPGYEGHMSAFGRVLSMLHAAGDGPLLIRVGGNSADHTFWEPDVRSMPRWMFQLTPSWLQAARLLVADTRGAPDPRSEPDHRSAGDRDGLGAGGGDRASAREHRRLRDRQRARHLQPLVLADPDGPHRLDRRRACRTT